MTTCYDKQHNLQQAFKELSISLTKQLSNKSTYSHSFTTQPYDLLITNNNTTAFNNTNNNNNSNNNNNNNNVSLTNDNLTPTLNLVQSLSSPTSSSPYSLKHLNDEPSSKTIKKKSSLYDILHSKQQPDYLPYTPFMNIKSSNDPPSPPLTHIYHHDRHSIHSSHFSTTPPSSIYSSDSSISSSSNSSHYDESIPTTPTLLPNKPIHQNNQHPFVTKKMRRVLSSSSSLASLTTHSSTRSKSSITNHHHLKWDWTIEESTLYHQRDENGKIKSSESSSINEVTERDIYGFKKPTEWVSLKKIHEFDHHYQSILIHQKEKWDQLLEQYDHEFPPLSSRIKRYVRKGIPHSYRGKAWMHYSGAKKRMDANPGLYEILLESANQLGERNEYAEVIVRDLHRTFPENIHFTCTQQDEQGNVHINPESNPRLVSLKNILLAFTIHSPQIGYCQSLNYLVGLFLLFTESEEEAFWLLVTVVHDYTPEKMYDPTMDGSITEQMVLMMMIYERMPSIWNKFANGRCFWECEQSDNMPSVTLVTNHWFLTMFINILPIETVLRIWDCFFIEGSKVLYKVALTLIKMNEQRMWALNDPMEIFPILQNMPRRLIDCHKFMERVFSKTGIASDITTQEIERIRGLFKDRRKQRRYKKFDEMVRNNQ